jgi:hypothetical protein
MDQAKKHKLIKAGYRVMDTKEFLGLSDREAALIELRIAKEQQHQPEKPETAQRQRRAAGGASA